VYFILDKAKETGYKGAGSSVSDFFNNHLDTTGGHGNNETNATASIEESAAMTDD
jgi:hypothetical protein